jgi:hypothetical protein
MSFNLGKRASCFGSGDYPMRSHRVAYKHDGNEAAGVPGLKVQSPATLGWRLRVERRHICHFGKTVRSGLSLVLMDSRRYRDCSQLLEVDTYGRPAKPATKATRFIGQDTELCRR